ncbi:WIAG-tail domain, partial [Caldalkalibacillus salinus]|uniref:WIAG-tail domain n=1 Tax=Caldalkalibacillus salinus TaxID=2803787 RepID=UPI0019242C72
INQDHLAQGIVQQKHVADGAITKDKLSFNPIQTGAKNRQTLQQCGILSFEFEEEGETVDVTVPLDEAYADEDYVIVAMTNHPACHCVIKEQTTETATITITRHKFTPKPNGIFHWIAIGKPKS